MFELAEYARVVLSNIAYTVSTVRDAGVVICPWQGADLHMTHLMPQPLTVDCSSKSRLILPFWY